MRFRVDLEVFRGPLDLLLYLVRKHEVEIVDLSVASITDQFLDHLTILEQIDVDAVGDFIAMASTLIEIKSRMVLPRADDDEEALEDPRDELVARLLEYKKFKDAASILEERSRDWQQRFARRTSELPSQPPDLVSEPIREVELWDLVSAFGRVMRDNVATQDSSIVYDDTPIHVYMERIIGHVKEQGRLRFSQLFSFPMHKSTMIGIFLALLELIRHHHVVAEQEQLFGEIAVVPGTNFHAPLDYAGVDNYDPRQVEGA